MFVFAVRRNKELDGQLSHVQNILKGCAACRSNLEANPTPVNTSVSSSSSMLSVSSTSVKSTSNTSSSSNKSTSNTSSTSNQSSSHTPNASSSLPSSAEKSVSKLSTSAGVNDTGAGLLKPQQHVIQSTSKTSSVRGRPPMPGSQVKKAPVHVLVSDGKPTQSKLSSATKDRRTKQTPLKGEPPTIVVTGSAQKVDSLKAVFENKSTGKSSAQKMISPGRSRLSTKNRAHRDLSSAFKNLPGAKQSQAAATSVTSGTKQQAQAMDTELEQNASSQSSRRPKRQSSGSGPSDAKRPCVENMNQSGQSHSNFDDQWPILLRNFTQI